MSDTLNMDVSHALTSADAEMSVMTPLTNLASDLSKAHPQLKLAVTSGRLTPIAFTTPEEEFDALTRRCGIYDLGWMTHVAVRGDDRVRWLSGMITNAVQQLAEGEGNYSFILNAQGRIQGDAFVFHQAGRLLLATESSNAHALLAHLEHFIIMDDVTLEPLDHELTAIGVAGPQATEIFAKLGWTIPELPPTSTASIHTADLGLLPLFLVTVKIGSLLRYEVWGHPDSIPIVWQQLLNAGAQPCGLAAVESLRIAAAIPRYGIDINDRDLAQETSQARALNFNKGCYLGQEIVERIRSRGAVHRTLAQFKLTGTMPELPADLVAGDKSIGKLTSASPVPSASSSVIYAIGIVRAEAISKGEPLTYNGGTAEPLDHPPALIP